MNPVFLISLGSVLWAMAIGYLSWVLLDLATRPRIPDLEKGRFEEDRRNELRQANWTYRTFEPWIDEMVGQSRGQGSAREAEVQQDLLTAGVDVPWHAREYLVTQRVIAVMCAFLGLAFGYIMFGWLGAGVTATIVFYGFPNFAAKQLRKRAETRRLKLKRQLASATDLLALMMEVGGGFQESLTKVAFESEGTALGYELTKILDDIESGKPRRDALQGFAQRVADTDTSDLVFAIVQGEELGTPLTTILRNQADQVRQKRSQWAEKACQEAQVTLVFPAMVIMVACLILVAAPFMLSALN